MNAEERWQETALVDIAYEVLNSNSKTMNYRDVFKEAANMKGLTDEELMDLLPQVFTEMNLDGRFICLSPSEWGLKKWYTTEAIEESIEALARSKGIDDDDDYGFEDEELSDEDYSENEDFENADEVGEDEDLEEEELDEDLDEDLEEDLEEDLGEDLDEDLVVDEDLTEEFDDDEAAESDFDEDEETDNFPDDGDDEDQ